MFWPKCDICYHRIWLAPKPILVSPDWERILSAMSFPSLFSNAIGVAHPRCCRLYGDQVKRFKDDFEAWLRTYARLMEKVGNWPYTIGFYKEATCSRCGGSGYITRSYGLTIDQNTGGPKMETETRTCGCSNGRVLVATRPLPYREDGSRVLVCNCGAKFETEPLERWIKLIRDIQSPHPLVRDAIEKAHRQLRIYSHWHSKHGKTSPPP